MFPLIVAVLLDAVMIDVELDTVDEALVVVGDVVGPVGETGSDIGDEGGDVLISINNGDLLVVPAFGAPFSAELLANCKYADNFGKISLTSSISWLQMVFFEKNPN